MEEKQKLYNIQREESSNKLIIENLHQMYNRNGKSVCGSVGLLKLFSVDIDVYGLYLTKRNITANGDVVVNFTPIYDEDGNHVFIHGDEHVHETPFAYGDSSIYGYSYIFL